MPLRSESLATLRTQSFDLLIIGGGIVGAGIARDAAMRGLTVALIEKGDFASGTSSKTSKLIHGGLRYLEQGRLRLVFESLRERDVLRTIAPQFVWPLSLMIPMYRGDARPPWQMACGLALYDLLALSHNPSRHRMRSAREALRSEPKLGSTALRAAAFYTDCQMDDARLCLANVLQAVRFGAICCNYVKLVALTRANGRICGAVVEDARTASQYEVKAAVVVNATGPWADTIRRLHDRNAGSRLAPTKGIHLVVPKLLNGALFFQAKQDRRMLFLLPWGDHSLIGTTESADIDQLDALHATSQEVDYLLAEVNRLVPEAGLTPTDIVASYAGARPLLAFSGSATGASREHRIEIDPSGFVSVMGGKYTTYRLMAKRALDLIVEQFRLPVRPAGSTGQSRVKQSVRGAGRRVERCLTDQISLLEPVQPVVLHRWQDVTRRTPPELLARCLSAYGVGTFRILELLEFEPGLAQPVCPHHEVMQAELVYAMREELACTVSDLLIRRTKIAYSACQGLDMLSTLTDLLMRYGRATREELEAQLEDYHRFLASSLSFRRECLSAHGLQ